MVSNGYVGKIKNSGAQIVKAPSQVPTKAKGAKVKKGKDLRTGS